jgi:hypothetical protein
MSYMKDLDEVDEKLLERELEDREVARSKGLCDYCGKPSSSPICKFPERHRDKRIKK